MRSTEELPLSRVAGARDTGSATTSATLWQAMGFVSLDGERLAGKATPPRAIRFIYGSAAGSKAPHLHAGHHGAHVPALKVAQMHVVSQLPLPDAKRVPPWPGFLGELLAREPHCLKTNHLISSLVILYRRIIFSILLVLLTCRPGSGHPSSRGVWLSQGC